MKSQGARRRRGGGSRPVFVVCLGGVGRKWKLVDKKSFAEVRGRNGLQSLMGKRSPAFRGAKMHQKISRNLAQEGGSGRSGISNETVAEMRKDEG